VLRDIDLVLQTKQVRLNRGKTQILSREEAIRHFRVFENAKIDDLSEQIRRKINGGLGCSIEKNSVELEIVHGLEKKLFDGGNGEETLKRWIGLAGKLNARISPTVIDKLIRLRPGIRETAL
jgi:hypothetical protein